MLFAIGGLAAGVATLLVVLGVMNGFQLGTIENLLEVSSFHLRVYTPFTDPRLGEVTQLRRRIASYRNVESVVTTAEVQALARGFWPEPQGVVVRAVPADWLATDGAAASRLRVMSGEFDVTSPGGVVVGTELAAVLGVRVGDPLSVSYLAGERGVTEVELTVTGVFHSGYLDFDRNWAFVSLTTAYDTLSVRDELVLGVKLHDRFDDQSVRQRIEQLPSVKRGESWREFNRAIFGALRTEKAMVVFLVALIFVVVAGNIFQIMRRSIAERRTEIAMLGAMGGARGDIRRVFWLEGWIIGVVGATLGAIIGILIVENVAAIFTVLEWLTGSRGGFASSSFYLQEVPVRVVPREVFGVWLSAVGAVVASAWIASHSATKHRPMSLLRSE